MKRRLRHEALSALPDDKLAELLASTRALRATSNGRRRMGRKSLDGQRYDSAIADLQREQKRRRREARETPA